MIRQQLKEKIFNFWELNVFITNSTINNTGLIPIVMDFILNDSY